MPFYLGLIVAELIKRPSHLYSFVVLVTYNEMH